jgi:hypothetical protein
MNVNSVDAVAGVANPDTEQFADRIPIQHSDLGFVKIQDRFDYRVSGRSAAKTRCSALEMLYLFGRCGANTVTAYLLQQIQLLAHRDRHGLARWSATGHRSAFLRTPSDPHTRRVPALHRASPTAVPILRLP